MVGIDRTMPTDNPPLFVLSIFNEGCGTTCICCCTPLMGITLALGSVVVSRYVVL